MTTQISHYFYCYWWCVWLPSWHFMMVASSFVISSPLSNLNYHHDKNTNFILTKKQQQPQKKGHNTHQLLHFAKYYNYNEDENADENEEEEEVVDPERKRMEMVRMIQKTYYQSSSSSFSSITTNVEENGNSDNEQQQQEEEEDSKIDKTTGKIYNLPLWRVNWVETPGRANVLNVHELQYTHMFETILAEKNDNNQPPWYVGHLYTPPGGGSSKGGGVQQKGGGGGGGVSTLQSWRDKLKTQLKKEEENNNNDDDDSSSSKVIGTLLRITDYRRLEDGRLMILVHGLERFVVDQVQQNVPYSTADVQLLPDLEMFTSSIPSKEEEEEDEQEKEKNEKDWNKARTDAILESIMYHEYECKCMELPLPHDCEYLPKSGLPLALIAKLLPFAFFDLEDESSLVNIPNSTKRAYDDDDDDNAGSGGDNCDNVGEIALEQQLIDGGILQHPTSSSFEPFSQKETTTKTMTETTLAELKKLETLIWLALDDLCINTKFTLPDEVLCLMPPHITYLHMEQPSHYLSSLYPSIRRQCRLSYVVPGLLEKVNVHGKSRSQDENDVNEQRQMLLEIPSIVGRLQMVLEMLERINDDMMGEFQ